MGTTAVSNLLRRRPGIALLLAASFAAACASVIAASIEDAVNTSGTQRDFPAVPTATPAGRLATPAGRPSTASDTAALPQLALVATPAAAEVSRVVEECTLRVQKRKVALPGAAELGGPSEAEMLTYDGRLVGPTIRVRRGTTLKVKVSNELSAADEPDWTSGVDQPDPPHNLYTTNLHTHGLHVSPLGASDDVFREIRPGESFEYVFTIPADHPAGTFWYHPHKHGSVAYQLGNGLAGALIVEGLPGDQIGDLDDVPEIANAKEEVLVLQQLVLRTDKRGIGRVDPADSYSQPASDSYFVTAVNGTVMPNYSMSPGEVQRWRFIAASREGYMMLCWYDDRGMRVNQMPFHEIAVDGLATGQIRARRRVTLFPGQRSDCLLKAPPRRGTYFLAAIQEDETAGANETLVVNYIARLDVAGAERPMDLPPRERLATCRPFPPLAASECRTQRQLIFSFDDKRRLFQINGLSFSEQSVVDQALLDTAEEWTLTALDAPEGSANEPHPFHLHVNPFEVVQIENLDSGSVKKLNEWRDTVAVEPGTKVTIRIRFRDFPGKTVLHCHTLDHEDQGMMRSIEVVDSARPELARSDSRSALEDCFVPAPPFAAMTTQGTSWDLTACVGHPVILVFFRGMQCAHCVRELRELLREARCLEGTGALVVAVSSEPIRNPAGALESLRAVAEIDFQLLIDERRSAFRDFGCFDKDPQHGLFVIDRRGIVRARYVGETPFDDARDACLRIQRLIQEDRQSE